MIVIVTYENYPSGSPGAIRNKSFADALEKMGYRVMIIHKGKQTNDKQEISLFKHNRYNKLIGFPYRVIRVLRDFYAKGCLDSVIFYSAGMLASDWLIKRWCLWHGVTFVCDVVEWYGRSPDIKWRFWKIIEKTITNRYLISKRCRVIAISRYLEQYFAGKGCLTVRIPIIKDITLNAHQPSQTGLRTFIYAGSHLGNDNIAIVIKAFDSLRDVEKKRVKFHIFGLSKERIQTVVSADVLERLDSVLVIHGRQPNSAVLDVMKQIDFCILLRDPELRVNQAGFPSKVVESMSMGVVMMCNYSSDLAESLRDGDNVVLVDEVREQAVADAIRRTLFMSTNEIDAMRERAQFTVVEKFSYGNFVNQFTKVLK